MMQKIDAPRLVQKILSDAPARSKALCVLSDDAIFSRLLLERLASPERAKGGGRALHFAGKTPAAAFLDHASQGGMFADPEPAGAVGSETDR